MIAGGLVILKNFLKIQLQQIQWALVYKSHGNPAFCKSFCFRPN